jgi:hypothetical protein
VATPGAADSAPALGSALRGSLAGCAFADLAGLSAAQREHCRDRLAANRGAGPDLSGFAVDPVKRAAFDAAADRARVLQKPFLADIPKNGCRPIVAHRDYSVGGQSRQDYSVSVGCGKSF